MIGKTPHLIFITSPTVEKLFWEKIEKSFHDVRHPRVSKIVVSDAEENKSLSGVKKIISGLLKLSADRGTLLVAFGGGTIGDLTGFVASIYMRGIPHIIIPTTLLADIDSCMGGKCGINLIEGKNLIGSFYHPRAVFIDTAFLEMLPQREWRSGFAEVIKYAILKGGKLWSLLRKHQLKDFQSSSKLLQSLIIECLKIKSEFIRKDEKDTGDRKLLNLGHTMAHALEAASAYRNLSHGEAVAQGLYFATDLSLQKKLCSIGTARKIYHLLEKYHFYRQPIPDVSRLFIEKDKKREGESVEWILIKEIGQCCRIKIPLTHVRPQPSFPQNVRNRFCRQGQPPVSQTTPG